MEHKAVTALENVTANLWRLQALLSLFAREYIDITDEEAQFNLSMGRETMVGAFAAIQELARVYEGEVSAQARQFHDELLAQRETEQ